MECEGTRSCHVHHETANNPTNSESFMSDLLRIGGCKPILSTYQKQPYDVEHNIKSIRFTNHRISNIKEMWKCGAYYG